VKKKVIGNAILYCGDCEEVLSELTGIDACVTDPPYGLSFMGKKWDYDVPSKELWKQVYNTLKPGAHLLSFFGSRTYHRGVVPIEDAGFDIRDQIMWIYGSGFPKSHNIGKKVEEYKGWGTALKPAHEPIVMARKPFKGTVVENVLKHGTGGINIDESRVETDSESDGRFPSNIIHDGSEEATEGFPITKITRIGNLKRDGKETPDYRDKGSAARYFYCAKTSRSERNEGLDHLPDGAPQRWNKAGEWTDDTTPSKNHHPTVKPVELMKYLCRLVTPKDRIVLDPFMGSGSTGVAALAEGFYFIGIEKEEEYFDIACARLQHFVDNQKTNLEKTFGV
jgi:site-specific DNA-methyltransferase (adenine-specific)